MVNISTTVRGHYGNDVYLWAIIIRRFCDNDGAARARRRNHKRAPVLLGISITTKRTILLDSI
jgi:hypothetical protein